MNACVLMTEDKLREENLVYAGTAGLSQNNRKAGFVPAFYDTETGRAEVSRFANGRQAPLHLIEGLIDEWVAERDADGRITAIKASVVAGFIRGEYFYTRAQAAAAAQH